MSACLLVCCHGTRIESLCLLEVTIAHKHTYKHTNTHTHNTHAHTPHHTHKHTGLTPETVSLKGTFEMSDNVFQENVAIRLGAAVTLLLRRAFNFKTQTITVFYNK